MTREETAAAEAPREARAPAVSVVVPAYNVARFIGEALDSVFAQTFRDFEVVVVNDGSPDTEELEKALAPYLGRVVYVKQENRGPSAARNAGIRAARGRHVALLDADDAWLPEYLAEQTRALASSPELDLIYSDAQLFGEGAGAGAGRSFMETCPSRGPVTVEALLSQACAVITSCVVARREALVAAGLFDERYRRSEDFQLWVRMAHRGARLGYQRKVLARHRVRPDSLAGDPSVMHECAMGVYRDLCAELELTPRQRALAAAEIEKYESYLALARGKRALAEGDYGRAAAELSGARSLLRGAGLQALKLRLTLLCLRVAPGLARRLYLKRGEVARASRGAAGANTDSAAGANTDVRITL
jgi:glycosyltransferase involved in cell wall biosynthesis